LTKTAARSCFPIGLLSSRTLRPLWGNGKSAHEDPNAKIVVYGHTKGAFAGFGLDGATLKRDESGNKALYGKSIGTTGRS
jgi:lipid-binding SYLF domain-containing protein